MTIILVLTSLILISIAVWQLTKILELSKPADYDDSEIASDKDNDMQGKLMFLFLIFIYALTIFSFYQYGDVILPESASPSALIPAMLVLIPESKGDQSLFSNQLLGNCKSSTFINYL